MNAIEGLLLSQAMLTEWPPESGRDPAGAYAILVIGFVVSAVFIALVALAWMRGARREQEQVRPNTSLPQWKELVKGLGNEVRAYHAFLENGMSIPDVATAKKLLGIKERTAFAPNPDAIVRPQPMTMAKEPLTASTEAAKNLGKVIPWLARFLRTIWQKADSPDSWSNRWQKIILWIAVVVICAMLAFPPWIATVRSGLLVQHVWNDGYHWFVREAEVLCTSNDVQSRIVRPADRRFSNLIPVHLTVDMDRLAIQLIATTVIAIAAFGTAGGRKKRRVVADTKKEATSIAPTEAAP